MSRREFNARSRALDHAFPIRRPVISTRLTAYSFQHIGEASRAGQLLIALTLFGIAFSMACVGNAEEVSFSRDVLPVLSDRCFHCHGPDEENREAGLRLDVESAAKEDLGGYAAITPNDLEASEIWNRITSDDEYEVMPPPDSHRKPLTEREREAVRQWIEQGAPWGKHWSFEPIQRPSLPELNVTKSSSSEAVTADESTHPIDSFVIARLADEDRTLSPPADSITQLRRLAFDLTGMSPTPEQIKRYQTRLRDGDPTAWTQAIEEMLESPHHAERMAMWWLDAARYSDSDGFQQDATRENWPWRDWVIEQFAQNRPFDEFTIEQFAGDLLPGATPEQKLATCFHRNHMTNGEGGRDPEESRIDYVIDRVNTTGTVWLGLTLGCVQCHTHKFDPITHHDYYSLSAFFNSIDEDGRAGMNAKPYLEYESPKAKQQSEAFAAFVKECEQFESAEKERAIQRFDAWLNDFQTNLPNEHVVWHTPQPTVSGVEGTQFQVEDNQIVQTTGPKTMHDDYRIVLSLPDDLPRVTGIRLEVFPHESHVDGRFSRDGNGEFTLTNVLTMGRRDGSPSETQIDLVRATADVEADKKRETKWDTRYSHIKETLNDDARDGWTTEGVKKIEPHVGVYELDSPWETQPGDQFIVLLRHRSTHGHANIGRFRISLTSEYGETVHRVDGGSPLKELVEFLRRQNVQSEADNSDASDAEPNSLVQLDDQLRKRLLDQYLVSDEAYQQASQRLSRARKQQKDLQRQSKPRRVMVLSEREKARDTHVLVRGVWDAKGDVVQRAVLPSVLPRPAEETQTRLDLANWIVDRENPLTARVIVNHLWQLMFGNGLVRTPGDFGLQGELPTHPKLLDWLAVELLDNDWDLNHVLRLIATSQTYRQSSVATPEMLQWDPENRMLARAPRFRLPAWMIRDNALRVSGLLTPTIGGPPVLPYQPDGVWAEITMGRFDYQPSVGPPQYRRTLYAFWRRSSAPTFLFDSAQRRVCEVGVRRTNTPLHALTLMNDTTMLEASRALADEAVAEANESISNSDASKTAWMDQANTIAMRVLSRELSQDELMSLQSVWDRALAYYDKHPESAVSYCTVGQRPPPTLEHAPPTAAWQTTASLLLNLDEAMTRE